MKQNHGSPEAQIEEKKALLAQLAAKLGEHEAVLRQRETEFETASSQFESRQIGENVLDRAQLRVNEAQRSIRITQGAINEIERQALALYAVLEKTRHDEGVIKLKELEADGMQRMQEFCEAALELVEKAHSIAKLRLEMETLVTPIEAYRAANHLPGLATRVPPALPEFYRRALNDVRDDEYSEYNRLKCTLSGLIADYSAQGE